MPLWRVIPLLGIAQIISWGSLYYSLTVLAAPIRAELGFSDLQVFGAFTLGLLASGVAAPFVGRRIDAQGGRQVMAVGSVIGGVALLIVATSQGALMFTVGWLLAGVAMSACLYDAAFASLYQIAPDRYRRAVTGLTLFGGFASTVFWPLSHALDQALDWRAALLIFSALHFVVCLPIHAWVLSPRVQEPVHTAPPAITYSSDRRFTWLAAAFAAATFVFGALSAFMVQALGSRGFTAAEAVWIGALVGPMQVLARVLEWFSAKRISAIAVGLTAFALALVAMALLNVIPASAAFGLLFAFCYGASNGILTIARGAVPVELFGQQRQGALLGALARPSFFAKAFAPGIFAFGLSAGIAMTTGLATLAIISAGALAMFWLAVRRHPADQPVSPSSAERASG